MVRECFFCALPKPSDEFAGGNICRQCRDHIRAAEQVAGPEDAYRSPLAWPGPFRRRGDVPPLDSLAST